MLGQVTPADPAGSGLRRVGVLTHLGRPEAIDTAVRLIEGLAVSGIRCAVPADDLDVLTNGCRRPTWSRCSRATSPRPTISSS